jgi:uncharacterized OB-fold protein
MAASTIVGGCTTASSTVIGGKCVQCMAGFFPTTLSVVTLTIDTNTCVAVGTAPLDNCVTAAVDVIGGQCEVCADLFYPTAKSVDTATIN